MRLIDADEIPFRKELGDMSDNPKMFVFKSDVDKIPTIDPASLRAKGEWISVEDRLPEAETDVIVFCGGSVDILTYRYNRRGNACFMYQDECGYWEERFAPSVTHWMPLPEPPNTEVAHDS